MAWLVMFMPVLVLAVLAGLVFAVEIERAQSRHARRGTVPPELRRRYIGDVVGRRH